MQLARKNIYNRCVIGIAALIWVLGLLAAGSDSVYMPCLKIAGAIVFYWQVSGLGDRFQSLRHPIRLFRLLCH